MYLVQKDTDPPVVVYGAVPYKAPQPHPLEVEYSDLFTRVDELPEPHDKLIYEPPKSNP